MNEEKVVLSIVIPVYNAEKTLETTVNSILNQAAKNFEIILMDDGSGKECAALCDCLAEGNPMVIKSYHQKNAGSLCARINALRYCKGEYIMYVDADDDIVENSLSLIFENLKTKLDLYLYDYYMDAAGGTTGNIIKIMEPDSYTEFDEQSKKIVAEQFMGGKMNSMCGLVWRKAIFAFQALELPEKKLRNGEDRLQKSIILYYAQSIAYIPKVIYHYKWYPKTQGGDVRRGLLNAEIYGDFKIFWSVERKFYDDFGFSTEQKARYSLQKIAQILGMLEKTYNNKWLKKNDMCSLTEMIARDDMFSTLENEASGCSKRKHIDTTLRLLNKNSHGALFAYWTLCNFARRLKYGKGK